MVVADFSLLFPSSSQIAYLFTSTNAPDTRTLFQVKIHSWNDNDAISYFRMNWPGSNCDPFGQCGINGNTPYGYESFMLGTKRGMLIPFVVVSLIMSLYHLWRPYHDIQRKPPDNEKDDQNQCCLRHCSPARWRQRRSGVPTIDSTRCKYADLCENEDSVSQSTDLHDINSYIQETHAVKSRCVALPTIIGLLLVCCEVGVLVWMLASNRRVVFIEQGNITMRWWVLTNISIAMIGLVLIISPSHDSPSAHAVVSREHSASHWQHIRVPTPDLLDVARSILVMPLCILFIGEAMSTSISHTRVLHLIGAFFVGFAAVSKHVWWAVLYPHMYGDRGPMRMWKHLRRNIEDDHLRHWAEGSFWWSVWLGLVIVLCSRSHKEIFLGWFHTNDEYAWYTDVVVFFIWAYGIVDVVLLWYTAAAAASLCIARSPPMQSSSYNITCCCIGDLGMRAYVCVIFILLIVFLIIDLMSWVVFLCTIFFIMMCVICWSVAIPRSSGARGTSKNRRRSSTSKRTSSPNTRNSGFVDRSESQTNRSMIQRKSRPKNREYKDGPIPRNNSKVRSRSRSKRPRSRRPPGTMSRDGLVKSTYVFTAYR